MCIYEVCLQNINDWHPRHDLLEVVAPKNLNNGLKLRSKIEKVPRGIRGEKSSKDMASTRNLVLTIGALAIPKMGDGTRCPERVSVPCLHATPVANAPWKPLIIVEGQARYQGHEIGGKSYWFGSHCWSKDQNGI